MRPGSSRSLDFTRSVVCPNMGDALISWNVSSVDDANRGSLPEKSCGYSFKAGVCIL